MGRAHTVPAKPYSRPSQTGTRKETNNNKSSLQALQDQYVNAPAGQNDCHLLWEQCKQLQPANGQCSEWVRSCQTLRDRSLASRGYKPAIANNQLSQTSARHNNNGGVSKVPEEQCKEHWLREEKTCPISLKENIQCIACFPCGHMMSEESYKNLQREYAPGPYVCPFCRSEAGNHEIRTVKMW